MSEHDDDLLDLTKKKLQLARFPDEQIDVGDDDWSQGAKVKVVKRLAEYWSDGYDWRAEEARINAEFNQFKVKIDIPDYGPQVLHYAHQASPRPDAIPLLFVQGWPGSFLEARKTIQPLTNPPDAASQVFHVVVPSIPGFGPGNAPERSGFGVQLTAHGFTKLMVEVLGYKRFVTQGGDWGSMITRSMSLLYPQNVCACHHNFFPCRPPPWEQDGYLRLQATRPQSLGFGLGDSPIGLLGCLVEKFHEWMDVAHYRMSDDEVLTFVMMHWMQGATPGLRYYKMAFAEEGEASMKLAFTKYLSTPIGLSHFPREIMMPPYDWVSSVANEQFRREHDKGGQFAAVECPELLVQDLRDWFSSEIVKTAMHNDG
ncbi:MAG: hypothetical protein Q9204_007281 [Flavoplaca sp. TL-2023a]